MQSRGQIFWGLALLLVGGFLLAVNFDLLPNLGPNLPAIIFIMGGLLFFTGYLTAGWKSWGLLFPAAILSAVGGTIWLSEVGLADELGGALIVGAVALPFWVAYVTSRSNWWAIIPGGILAGVSFLILGTAFTSYDGVAAGLFVSSIGLVFLIVHVARRDFWWALIPGGILLSIGLAISSVNFGLPSYIDMRLFNFFFYYGIGLTFAYLWLKREDYPTAWGKYPAVVLFIIGTFAVIVGSQGNLFFPVLLITLGAWILFQDRRGRRFWDVNW